jgi:hypothetical protein
MGPAELVRLLVQRSGREPQADRHLAGRAGVAANGVVKAVGERAEAPGRIDRQVAAPVQPARLGLAGWLGSWLGGGLGGWLGWGGDGRKDEEKRKREHSQ